jgi:hypothetical protein
MANGTTAQPSLRFRTRGGIHSQGGHEELWQKQSKQRFKEEKTIIPRKYASYPKHLNAHILHAQSDLLQDPHVQMISALKPER